MQNLSWENRTQLKLVQKDAAGYLTLLTKFEGSRDETKDGLMRVFWFLFEKTAARVDDEVMERIELPPAHTDIFNHTPVQILNSIEVPLAHPWHDTIARAKEERCARGEFDWEGAHVAFAEAMFHYTGSWDMPRPLGDFAMTTMLDRALNRLRAQGWELLGVSGEAPECPLGLRTFGGFPRPLSAYRVPTYVFGEFAARVVMTVGNYKNHVMMYTVGYQSLHENFPNGGYKWMQRGNAEAIQYVPIAMQEKYNMVVGRFVDCLPLKSDKRRIPRGHLGFHPANLGLILGDGRNRAWRVERYVELWLMLQSTIMTFGHDDTVHVVDMCRQGKHRSVAWMVMEAIIFKAFRMFIWYENTCKWTQEMERCQRQAFPFGCEWCGNSSRNRRNEVPVPGDDICKAVLNEFFEVVLILENMA